MFCSENFKYYFRNWKL